MAEGGSVNQNDTQGFPKNQWEIAREEMRLILVETAVQQTVIPYSELTEKVNALRLDPHSDALTVMLGQISEAEDRVGRGMLTVLVVHKSGDHRPGPGFFDLARALGRDTSDLNKCWIAELREVHDYWKRNRIRRRTIPSPW